LKLAQQATLETRDGKPAPTSFADKLTDWRNEAAALLGHRAIRGLETEVLDRNAATSPTPEDLEQIVASIVDVVSTQKATWTR
jgi:hypothetical protein